MQIEEAIKRCNRRIKELKLHFAIDNLDLEAIEVVLNELDRLKRYEELEWQEFNELAVASLKLQKKDKVIDMMAKQLSKEFFCWQGYNINCFKTEGCKKCVKEYFFEKASEENVADGR